MVLWVNLTKYTAFLKYANLSFSLTKAVIEDDFKAYIESLIDEAEGKIIDKITKSAGFDMDWAKALFELSDSFGELADILAEKPNYYKEIFEYCATVPNYRIFFEYKNGMVEEVSDISNKLS